MANERASDSTKENAKNDPVSVWRWPVQIQMTIHLRLKDQTKKNQPQDDDAGTFEGLTVGLVSKEEIVILIVNRPPEQL